MNFIKTVAAHLLRVGACAAVLYCAALIALHATGFSFVTVSSESMNPALHRGDLVVIAHGEPSAHEIVLFRQNHRLVIHRLLRLTSENTWVTQGDANVSEDPWKVAPNEIQGTAQYVIRGFGIPLLAWQSAVAVFSKTQRASASARSSYWAQATMAWKTYANSFYITSKNPNYVSMIFNGDRKIWSTQSFPSVVHFHMFGKLSAQDATNGGFHVMLNSCVSATDVVNCGLAITFNAVQKKIELRSLNNGNFSGDWTSTNFTPALTQDHHFSIYRGANSIQVQVDGEVYLNVTDLAALAQAARTTIPSGASCGVWLYSTNRITDARINFW